jgi:hypothetical protein
MLQSTQLKRRQRPNHRSRLLLRLRKRLRKRLLRWNPLQLRARPLPNRPSQGSRLHLQSKNRRFPQPLCPRRPRFRPRLQRPSSLPNQPTQSQNHRLPRFDASSCRKPGRAPSTKLRSYHPEPLHRPRRLVEFSAGNQSSIDAPQAAPVLPEDLPSVPWALPANLPAGHAPNIQPARRRVALHPGAPEVQADVPDSVRVLALPDSVPVDSAVLVPAALAAPAALRPRQKLHAPSAQARPRVAVDASSIRRPRKAR